MSRNQRNGQYAYRRIQDAIRKRIESGKLRAGDMVQSERELARIHKVSLMTARHALADLAREGIVERKHGAGTFVAPPKIHFNKLMSYTEQMSSRGLSARSKIVRLSSSENDPEIAARLSLPSTSQLTVVQRVRRADDEPFALETCYLSADQFPGIANPSLERGSIFAALEREYGVNLAYADEEIDATDADQRTAELLSIPRGTALLRMRQLIYSSKGIPTIYVVGLYRSGRHTLLIRRFR
ncbi:MAG TPA: GntR family transcriptional regulator [Candidatus Acidoferrales bacterium]|nr:GntR family transcriptional regulator [Candidatus Acidoferrales bacterium]